ncbi:MAG: hypothetical protein JRE40_14145 [Deltaproteobacteria bacterium]|nr:hypothetical protein [Deltaproteobacteria bacterium]
MNAMLGGHRSSTWAALTGYEGIFCGASAIYCAMAQVINESYGRVVMPLGEK